VTNDDINNFRFVESVEGAHGDQTKQNEIARRIGIKTAPLRMDSQVKYGVVASGQAVLYFRFPNPHSKEYRENIWDHAAGAIIVEEAGGKVTDMDGKALNFRDNEKMLNNRGVVASNGGIHEQVLLALKE
jgi:3'(2'), 5'-bisphosphate nucleotidase